ncbi:recombinase family protein [Rummeliibacillus suwonensis]|uniref:recombinase family protein n=1 Tax=Rummeliibacillus suwonensis TaxID=1306154 RepID=UPI001AAE61AC|nr:recombinase family protein [Rummeliibacillus suwonensis]MBO2535990.1 recombinase family protein [Rummeliibacillus suwonensis]
MTTYAYIRVSSVDQNEARQIANMKKLGVEPENMYIDKFSGKNTDRPQYQALKALVVEGDTVIFDSITRLSRNYYDVKDEYEYFIKNGVFLEFIKEPMLNTPKQKVDDIVQVALADAILSLLAAFAQKEREDIRLRQAEGIAIAKANGKYKGRQTKLTTGGEEEVRMKAIIDAYKNGVSIADIRKTYKVGTGTIYRLLEREGIKR